MLSHENDRVATGVEESSWVFRNNGVRLEPHEENTAKFLVLYGFNIEAIRPMNTPKLNNPDILMNGTIWEMKAPIKYNENTLKIRMKKASKQAKRIVFDFRNMKRDYEEAQAFVIKLFIGNREMRRMIIVTKDKKVLDFYKR